MTSLTSFPLAACWWSSASCNKLAIGGVPGIRHDAPTNHSPYDADADRLQVAIPTSGDEAMDAYVEWRQRCDEVWVAYSYWETARTGTVELCHAAYAAALRREEQASQSYATLVHRVTDLQAADPQRVQPDLSGRGATAAPPA